MDAVLARQANDSSLVWKATTLHHPTLGLFYPDSAQLANTFLGKLKDHKYDVYFNGHEHLLNHATIPLNHNSGQKDQT